MSTSKQPLTQTQLAHILRRSTMEIERLVKKEGLPCRGRKKGVMFFDIAKVVHWLIERNHRKLEEERTRRDERSLPELAQLLKCDPRTINKMVKERGLPKEARGIYIPSKVIPWIVDDYERRIKEARAGGETESQARKRLWSANANLKEITLAKQRAEVIQIDEAVLILQDALNILRQRLIVFPKRAAPQLERLETNAEREDTLKSLIHDLLRDLAAIPDTLHSKAKLGSQGAPEGLQDPAAPASHDRKRVVRRKKVSQRRNRK